METMTPSAEFFLDHFFRETLARLGATASARTRRVHAHLRDYVDRNGHVVMCEHQLTEYAFERELDPVGAAGRVLVPIDLFHLLVHYAEPANLLPDRLDASRQVRVLSELASSLIRCYSWGDIACSALELRAAIARMRTIQRRR